MLPVEPVPLLVPLLPEVVLLWVAIGVPVEFADELPLPEVALLWVAMGVPVILALGVPVAFMDEPLLELPLEVPAPLLEAPALFTTTPLTVPTCCPFWPLTFIFMRLESRTNWPVPVPPVLGILPEEAVGVPATGVPVEAAPPAAEVAVPVLTPPAAPVAAGVPVTPAPLVAALVATAGVPVPAPVPPAGAVPVAPGADVPPLEF